MPAVPAVLAVLLAAWHVVFPLSDARLTEASGLVDLGGVMVTANDSGNDPLLFVLDARTGRTVHTVRYAGSQTDTEALAPAGRDAVWVGDVGDNLAQRAHVEVVRMPLGGGPGTTYRLAYPDGPHDAESLFVAGGRLYVVTKQVLDGAFYAAPRRLRTDGVNRLERVAPAMPLATDAAAFPDGRRVLVRGYGSATVYALPSFHRLGSFALPAQPQGEAVSIGPGDRVRLASEGARTAVLQVSLPAALSADPTTDPTADPTAEPTARPRSVDAGTDERPPWTPWLGGAALVVVVAVVAAWSRRRTLRP